MRRLFCMFIIAGVTELFCLPGVASSVFAQTVIDADTAVEMALEYNIGLKISRLDLELQGHTKKTAWNNFTPTVSLGSTITRGNGEMLFPGEKDVAEADRWGMDVNISAQWSLGASSFTSFRKAVWEYEQGLLTYEDAVRKMERDVLKAFYDLLVKAEDIRISQLSYANAERKYMQDSANYEKGLVSEMVLMKSRLAYETAKSDIETKNISYEAALSSFRAMLGLERGLAVRLDGTIDPQIIVLDADALVREYLYQRSDVRQQMASLEELKRQKTELYVSSYTPVFSASYGLSFGNIFNRPSLSDSGSLRLSLSIPLDSFIPGTKSSNTFYAKQIDIDKQELRLLQTVEAAKNSMYESAMLINRTASSIEMLKLNEQIAQRSYDLTWAAYQRGETDYQSVTDADEALQSARQKVLAERFSYRSRLLDLEYELGVKLAGDR